MGNGRGRALCPSWAAYPPILSLYHSPLQTLLFPLRARRKYGVENLNEISAVGPDRFALALEMLPLHDPQVGSPIFSEVSSI